MKTKSFDEYLEKRLNKAEIAEIEEQAKLEKEGLVSLQQDIWNLLQRYMKKEDIGFNELGRRLDVTPTQLSRIQKAQANLIKRHEEIKDRLDRIMTRRLQREYRGDIIIPWVRSPLSIQHPDTFLRDIKSRTTLGRQVV